MPLQLFVTQAGTEARRVHIFEQLLRLLPVAHITAALEGLIEALFAQREAVSGVH
ncbi:hypothetical protein H4F75_21575 (plasmid) [Enterobacter asburiae]|jgi:hypothetical protein|uniref:hypothetical protein n=1 Tax=Enterobacter asburiae TaxID=61645 RepID=UPI00174BDC86|nr:hypothetical protein [Enterobacter asburiae]MBN4802445.1 hypothetical protein [Enterobacter asburiae]MBN4806913.1 hypothetical protein [Enterobacter asburiae]